MIKTTRKPVYRITLDGEIIQLQGRLVTLSLVDKSGFESDELTIDISDHDGAVALPTKGAELTAEFGFENDTQNKGEYIVDDIEHHGPPDVVTIRAHAANFRETLLQGREQSYHQTTLGDVLSQIAARNQLEPAIADKYSGIAIKHLDQNNESDANLLTRLARDYGAIGTIKSNRLLFIERATGKSASGASLPTATIIRSESDSHNYREVDRSERVTGVKAYYHVHKEGKRKHVLVGTEGYCRNLKRTFATKAEAQRVAEAELKRLKSSAKTLGLNLALGRADLFAEQPLKVVGYKTVIDATSWYIKTITHTLDDNGYTCAIECEVKQ